MHAVTELTTDVLVIGGALAALRAAIAAAEAGARVTVSGKGIIARSGNTVISSAGVAGYLPDPAVEDSVEQHRLDTYSSGRSINDPALASVLVQEAGDAIVDLQRFGVSYIRSNDAWDKVRVPGHTRPRSFRAAPWESHGKGLSLTMPLRRFAEGLGVQMLDATPVISLHVTNGRVCAATAVELNQGSIYHITCGAVIIATGGCAYLYSRTNGTRDVTGDGLALALQAGATLRDMEFVQFHPTRMDHPAAMLLSDGLCADGAVLRDKNGREFCYDYHPMGSMAPRDVRAWAIFNEMQAGNGVEGGVYLDCSAIPMERLQLRHGPLLKVLQNKGWDLATTPLVTSPAAHFLMGGIAVDLDGYAGVPGLYAAGESAGGAHGANRLGSMGLTEAVVFGRRAGEAAARHAAQAGPGPEADRSALLGQVKGEAEAEPIEPQLNDSWRRLRESMWSNVSLMRSEESLARALADIAKLRSELASLASPAPAQMARLTDLRLALVTAEAIVSSAKLRRESRGAHRRSDCPEEDAAWLGNIFIRRSDAGLEAEFRELPGAALEPMLSE